MLAVYNSLSWFLGIFAILVGGLGMMNAMLMSVFERTHEIGVLRALGWRRRRIITLILGEALAVSISGGVLGIVLGIGLIKLASLSSAVGGFLSGTLDPNSFVQVLVTAVALGAIGGAYPACRAASPCRGHARRGRLTRWLAGVFRSSALRNLWRRPTRTLLTTLGLGMALHLANAPM